MEKSTQEIADLKVELSSTLNSMQKEKLDQLHSLYIEQMGLEIDKVLGKSLIPVLSLASMLGEKETVHSGQHDPVLQASEELSCLLTNEVDQSLAQGEVINMVYAGSISTLKDGRFMVQIEKGKKADGSRNRESKSFRDMILAQTYLDNRLKELNGVNNVIPTVQPMGGIPFPMVPPYTIPAIDPPTYTDKTFEQYAIDALNAGIGKAKSRTINGYREDLFQVVKHLGGMKILEIDDIQLRKVFDTLSYHYVKNCLKKSFRTTKMIFEIAVSNKDIPSTPFTKLKCPNSKRIVDDEMEAYSDEDITVILSESKAYQNPILYPMFAICECTGMRPGELRALEWSKFNLAEKTLAIRQAISREYDEIESITETTNYRELVSITKSAFSVRTLRLSDLAVEALLEWRKILDNSPAPMKNSKFIFPSRQGDFKSETSVKSLIQRFAKKVGIKDMGLTLYRFRHTMCTRLILAGQPIPVIQRIIGDNTVDMIMKIYTHVTEKQAMAACGEYYDQLNQRHLAMVV